MGIAWQLYNSLWLRVVMSFLAGSFACPPAKAQSFFETVFGIGAAKPKAERVVRKPGARMGRKPQTYSEWKAERFQSSQIAGDYIRDPAFGGSYKTVCVRTCDGYFWPVSRSVTSERFERDAQKCDASCAGEAKLYYQHKNSDDPKTLIGLDGGSYTDLKSAFLYRRQLISGCGCRPAPWSVAENLRHREYKVAEDANKLQIAMAQARKQAEAVRQDKIAQIIAATREATTLDAAEEATFGDAVAAQAIGERPSEIAANTVTVVELQTDPKVSVTGYVHLHVLPDAVVEAEKSGSDGKEVAELEVAVQAIATPPAVADKASARARKARNTPRKLKTPQPAQTVSLFGVLSSLTWPGGAP